MIKKKLFSLILKKPRSLRLCELLSLLCDDKEVVWISVNSFDEVLVLKEYLDVLNLKLFVLENTMVETKKIQVFIGKRVRSLERVVKLFSSLELSISDIGFELGYPKCCVENFVNYREKFKGSLIEFICNNSPKNKVYPFYLNNIGATYSLLPRDSAKRKLVEREIKDFIKNNSDRIGNFVIDYIVDPLITWHPCSYVCNESLKRAKKVFDFLKSVLPDLSELKKDYLSKSVLFLNYFQFVLLEVNIVKKNNYLLIDNIQMLNLPRTKLLKCLNFKDGIFEKNMRVNNFRVLNDKLKKFIFIPFSSNDYLVR